MILRGIGSHATGDGGGVMQNVIFGIAIIGGLILTLAAHDRDGTASWSNLWRLPRLLTPFGRGMDAVGAVITSLALVIFIYALCALGLFIVIGIPLHFIVKFW